MLSTSSSEQRKAKQFRCLRNFRQHRDPSLVRGAGTVWWQLSTSTVAVDASPARMVATTWRCLGGALIRLTLVSRAFGPGSEAGPGLLVEAARDLPDRTTRKLALKS